MFTALLTIAATASVLAWMFLGYIPKPLVLTTVVCLLIVVF